MVYNICIINPFGYPFSQCFYEMAEYIYYGLLELGHVSQISINDMYPDMTNIILGSHLVPLTKPENSKLIIFQSEDVEDNLARREFTDWRNTWYANAKIADDIWDFCDVNIQALAKDNLHAKKLYLGYQWQMERIKPEEKIYDVFFYGCVSGRRSEIINKLTPKCKVKVVPYVWGTLRDYFLARSKIVLNVFSGEANSISGAGIRISYALNNKLCVITESGVENPYLKILSVNYGDIVTTVLEVLKDSTWERLAEKGNLDFKIKSMAESLTDIL